MPDTRNSGDFDWLVERLAPLGQSVKRPGVVAISGHAGVGKTALARRLVRRWRNALRLETESCILGFSERSQLQVSGCRVEAHNLELYTDLIERLLTGETVCFRSYDWKTRASTGRWVRRRLPPKGILVLDGTIPPHPAIAAYCQRIVFLRPTNYHRWLRFAANRDVNERFRSRAVAIHENKIKYSDSLQLQETFSRNISDFVDVRLTDDIPPELLFTLHEVGAVADYKDPADQLHFQNK